jgi:hypothetical protein
VATRSWSFEYKELDGHGRNFNLDIAATSVSDVGTSVLLRGGLVTNAAAGTAPNRTISIWARRIVAQRETGLPPRRSCPAAPCRPRAAAAPSTLRLRPHLVACLFCADEPTITRAAPCPVVPCTLASELGKKVVVGCCPAPSGGRKRRRGRRHWILPPPLEVRSSPRRRWPRREGPTVVQIEEHPPHPCSASAPARRDPV